MTGLPKTLLGFDYGTKRIGIAVGQSITHSASPLTTLTSVNDQPDWDSISKLIQEWKPDALVLGLPVNADGSASDVTRRVQRFGNQLQGRYNLPVHTIDERLSSVKAENHLAQSSQGKQQRARYAKADVDKIAAAVILESWFASQA